MFRVYAYFVTGIGIRCLVTAAGAYLVLLMLEKLGADYRGLAFMCVFMSIFTGIPVTSTHVSRHLPWLHGLPLRKRELLALNFLINATLYPFIVLLGLICTFCFWVTVRGITQTLGDLSFLGKLKADSTYVMTVYDYSGYLLAAASLLALFFLIMPRDAFQQKFQASFRDSKRILKLLGGGVLLIVVAHFTRSYWECAWVYEALFLFGGLVFLPRISLNNIAIPAGEKRAWTSLGLCILACSLVLLFVLGKNDIRSGIPARVAGGTRYLGPYSGKFSEMDLAKVIESDISSRDLAALGAVYKHLYSGDKAIKPHEESHALSLERAVMQKSSLDRVFAATQLFELKESSSAELNAVIQKLSAVRKDEQADYFLYYFATATFSSEEVVTLLESKEPLANFFGFIYARAHRHPSFIPPIQRNLARYSDELKRSALLTLSVLAGRAFTLEDLEPIQRSTLRVSFWNADCANFGAQSVQALNAKDEGLLNVCLREKARDLIPGETQRLENLGWFHFPMRSGEKTLFDRVFKVTSSKGGRGLLPGSG